EPVDQAAYARFLADWQHLRPRAGRDGAWRPPATLEGVDGVATVLDQLAGTPLPASAWESLVPPAPAPRAGGRTRPRRRRAPRARPRAGRRRPAS
ncbi:Lhr family ATP-dependent helicase, partial [Micrococcus sp. F3Y]|uniref:Lhr family ATP-dependent helicase n=1 Tax=Micrococcus sp. F3Y TaxID=3402627 RepID=UPI003AF42575